MGKVTCCTCQKNNRSGKIVRRAPSPSGYAGKYLVVASGIPNRLREFRLDVPGRSSTVRGKLNSFVS
jgi:hypothetical protein